MPSWGALQSRTGPVQGQNRVFAHREKPALISWNPCKWKQVFLCEKKLHREHPVFITGLDFQCVRSPWGKPWITNNFLTCSILISQINKIIHTGFHTWWYLGWLLLRIKLLHFGQNPAFYKVCQKWQHPHIKLCKNQVLALELTYINVNTKGIQQYWWKLHAYLNRYVHGFIDLSGKIGGKKFGRKNKFSLQFVGY